MDRLPERRGKVEEAIGDLDDRLDSLSADELEDARIRIVDSARSLEQTMAAAPPPPQVPVGKLRRTRRRGIYRVGSALVVVEPDEDGISLPRPVASLAEAIILRESLRAARRHPHRELVERSVWEDKPL